MTASEERLDNIDKCHSVRLAGNRDQYKAISRTSLALLGRDRNEAGQQFL